MRQGGIRRHCRRSDLEVEPSKSPRGETPIRRSSARADGRAGDEDLATSEIQIGALMHALMLIHDAGPRVGPHPAGADMVARPREFALPYILDPEAVEDLQDQLPGGSESASISLLTSSSGVPRCGQPGSQRCSTSIRRCSFLR